MFLRNSALLLTKGTLVGESPAFLSASHTVFVDLPSHLILFGSVIAFTAYSSLMEHYSSAFIATPPTSNRSSRCLKNAIVG